MDEMLKKPALKMTAVSAKVDPKALGKKAALEKLMELLDMIDADRFAPKQEPEEEIEPGDVPGLSEEEMEMLSKAG